MSQVLNRPPSHEGNISALKRRKCAQQFMIFGGFFRHFMTTAPDMLRNFGIADRNTLLLRDPYETFYERGVSQEINSPEKLTEWLYNHLRSNPQIREAYSIGNSAGGYAAIYFGCKLGLDQVFAFSPSGLERIPKLVEMVRNAPPRTRINVFFDRYHERDAYIAGELGTCENVRLLPSAEGENDGHWVMLKKIERDELRDVFPPFLAVEEPNS